VAKLKTPPTKKMIEKPQQSEEQEQELTQTFPEIIYQNLPDFLQYVP
jgi:hypothetical protein